MTGTFGRLKDCLGQGEDWFWISNASPQLVVGIGGQCDEDTALLPETYRCIKSTHVRILGLCLNRLSGHMHSDLPLFVVHSRHHKTIWLDAYIPLYEYGTLGISG